jgi:hypothetical protein
MSPYKRKKVATGVLYTALGVLGLVGIGIVGFEFVSPPLIAEAYAETLAPWINGLISDRSYPVWHFQMVAGVKFYRLVLLVSTIAVIAAVGALLFRDPSGMKRAVRPVVSFFRSLPPVYGGTIVLLLGGLLTVQVIDENRFTFPLTSWKVYGKMYLPYELVHYEFRARTVEGDTVMINPERLWRSADGIIYNGIQQRAEAIAEPSPDAEPVVFENILRAMAAEYSRTHETDLATLDVTRITNSPLQADTVWQRSEVVRRLELQFSSEASATP